MTFTRDVANGALTADHWPKVTSANFKLCTISERAEDAPRNVPLPSSRAPPEFWDSQIQYVNPSGVASITEPSTWLAHSVPPVSRTSGNGAVRGASRRARTRRSTGTTTKLGPSKVRREVWSEAGRGQLLPRDLGASRTGGMKLKRLGEAVNAAVRYLLFAKGSASSTQGSSKISCIRSTNTGHRATSISETVAAQSIKKYETTGHTRIEADMFIA